jgi:hypothetical protein
MGLILDLPQPQPTIAPPPRPTNARFRSDYRVEQLRAIQEKIATMIEAKARNIDLEPEVAAEAAVAPAPAATDPEIEDVAEFFDDAWEAEAADAQFAKTDNIGDLKQPHRQPVRDRISQRGDH